MVRLLSRTSITIDEAVSILLGRSTGPIELWPLEDSEEADAERPMFSLQDHLEDERDVLEGEYDLAKYENEPEDVIAEKHAALQRQEAAREEANKHRCAINHELNKGEQSTLKLDRALSNAAYTFITLHSFNQWVKSSADQSNESAPLSSKAPNKKARTRMRDQQDAILEEIRRQGFDPQALPPKPPGLDGVKAAVCYALKDSPLFKGSTIFDKAWGRLRKLRLIIGQD